MYGPDGVCLPGVSIRIHAGQCIDLDFFIFAGV
jgi:hypothetical protein